MAKLCCILNLEVIAEGDIPQQPTLIVSNHISWLDIAVLGSLTHTSFLAKEEISRWPIIGWFARSAGTLFLPRGKGQTHLVSQAISKRLQGDHALTLFPEATTTDGRQVKPFFPRLFGAAIESGIPVLPVALRYEVDGKIDETAPFIDDQHILANAVRILSRRGSRVRVHFGSILDSQDVERKALADAAYRQVTAMLSGYQDS